MAPRDAAHYQNQRFEIPSGGKKWISPYDFSSQELQNLEQKTTSEIYSEVLDLTTAQTFNNPKVIKVPGRAVAIYGINTTGGANDSEYDPVANVGTEKVATDVMVYCRFNEQSNDTRDGASLKHNRGFRGDFTKLYLSWPAQSARHARIYIYKYDDVPWQNGESAT